MLESSARIACLGTPTPLNPNHGCGSGVNPVREVRGPDRGLCSWASWVNTRDVSLMLMWALGYFANGGPPSTVYPVFLHVAWSTLRIPLSLNMISVRAPFVPDHGASKSLSLNRGSQEPLAHHKWYLHVRMFPRVNLLISLSSNLISSWEFVSTLNYELDIIRGRRSYRWTIWVCNGKQLTWPPFTALDPRTDLLLL